MLYNLNEINVDPFEDKLFDVCIIGGGVVGITLAMYLNKNLNIVLLEAGGMDYSEESQEVYEGDQIGYNTSYSLKNRGGRWLGGSSNMWGGRCSPFLSTDFKKRDYIKNSGWPISKEDLDPYSDETKFILDLPKTHKQKFYKGWTDILEKEDGYFKAIKFLYSDPITNFKTKYENDLKNKQNIHCYINANLTNLQLTDELSDVQIAKVENYRKGTFEVRAKKYILATGGIENPRLLLNFNKQMPHGIGNNNDMVGRYFSDHSHSGVGSIIMEDEAENAFADSDMPENILYASSVLAPTEKLQREEKLNSLEFHVRPKKELFSPLENKFKEKLLSVIGLSEWSRYIAEKIKGGKLRYDGADGTLMIMQEQEPNPLSRVTLDTKTDKFGLKRAILDWQFVENDALSCKKISMIFAKRFAALNLGRVKIDDWLLKEKVSFSDPDVKWSVGGWHLMGTTRMGTTPQNGVVDSNQRVFGINNLYIGGSSVFPTYGSANPTYTIVQMTLRLANHLNNSI